MAEQLTKYVIYAKDYHAAAKLAATMDLHLSQWSPYFQELYVEEPFAEEL